MEEHQRKLLAETERKLMDTKSRAQRDLMTKEEKLARIRGILDTQTTPGTVSKNLKMKTYGSSSTVRNVSIVSLVHVKQESIGIGRASMSRVLAILTLAIELYIIYQ